MLEIPHNTVDISKIPLQKNIELFVKREDQIHPEISGNKYWKLFYNINQYLESKILDPLIITFGGAYSNHLAAVASLGKLLNIKTIGIVRGEELQSKISENATLKGAFDNGMQFRFVSRTVYRDKEKLTEDLTKEFPHALIIPEGGSNDLAVRGVQHMLSEETKDFDYLCSAVGTGGTLGGLSKYCEEGQKVLGLSVVKDDSLEETVFRFSGKRNFSLLDASEGGYGKISDDLVTFINDFGRSYGIKLDPIYTGKMMKSLMQMIDGDQFPDGSKILAFHTGGLQGIEGANALLRTQNRKLIEIF